MAHFKQPPKRRRSLGARRSSSRTTSALSVTTSASRYSTPSRYPSTISGHGRGGQHMASTPSHRPVSVSSRMFGEVEVVDATEQAPDDSTSDEDTLSEVIMGVSMSSNGTVGCAYYVARNEKLYFMEDVRMGGPDIVDTRLYLLLILYAGADRWLVKLFIDPTVVLVSSKCEEEVVNRLDPESRNPRASEDGRSGDQTRLPYLMEFRPNAEFGYEPARNKLVNLRIGQRDGPSVTFVVPGDVVTHEDDYAGGEGGLASRQGQLLRLAGWINMESRITVGCAGAVLSYLQRRRVTTYLPGDQAAASLFKVATVEMFTLSGSMFVNSDTLLSLQITSTESHPNAQNQGPGSRGWSTGGAKEGLSVYGLFHHFAKTSQGRFLLRQYFVRPSLNIAVINERLDTISVLHRPDNAGLLDQIAEHLSKIKNMRFVTVNIRKGISSGNSVNRSVSTSVWPTIRAFVFYALRIFDHMVELVGGENLTIRTKITQSFDKQGLAAVGIMINDTVDFEATKEQRRTVVRTGVDAELDEVKRTYEGIEPLLSQVTDYIATIVPAELDAKINVIFFPQIGFLIACPLDEETGTSVFEGPEDDEWERMFVTEAAAYHKNSNMREMDEHFGDIYGRICDREIEIVQELGDRVLEYEELLIHVSDICGELDSLVALAKGAKHHNLVRPRLTEDNIIKIKGGRHPLQELTVPSFVGNNTHIVGGSGTDSDEAGNASPSQQPGPTASQMVPGHDAVKGPSMVLLTGPNYSGKSVYLKQVAIIVFMAHIGSFVPAESAKIGLTDKILTRISTRESVSRIQSAFMIDLQQISIALNLATRRSLIIIDEFGKGTETTDGAGLAAAVFEHLLQRRVNCPKVLGATHFHEIFESGFLQPRASLSFAHMEIKMNSDAPEAEGQITYLYNYCPERSTSSFGTICAAMNGIEPAIIEKADQLLLLAVRGADLVEVCAELPDAELAELEDAASHCPTSADVSFAHWVTGACGARVPRNRDSRVSPTQAGGRFGHHGKLYGGSIVNCNWWMPDPKR